MAIAFDTTSSVDESYTGSTITLSHTVTGSDPVLIVGVNPDTSAAVTSMTYNGVAMTKQNGYAVTGSTTQRIEMWYLQNPATGVNDIVVTFDTASAFASVRGASYTGVLGTVPDAFNNQNECQTCDSLATSVTTVDDNCWTVLMARTPSTMTAGAGTTFRHTGAFGVLDSNAALTPAGVKTLNVNRASATYHAHIMISLSPVAATSTQNALAMSNF